MKQIAVSLGGTFRYSALVSEVWVQVKWYSYISKVPKCAPYCFIYLYKSPVSTPPKCTREKVLFANLHQEVWWYLKWSPINLRYRSSSQKNKPDEVKSAQTTSHCYSNVNHLFTTYTKGEHYKHLMSASLKLMLNIIENDKFLLKISFEWLLTKTNPFTNELINSEQNVTCPG